MKTAGSRLSLLDARILTGLEDNGMLDPGKLPLLGIVRAGKQKLCQSVSTFPGVE